MLHIPIYISQVPSCITTVSSIAYTLHAYHLKHEEQDGFLCTQEDGSHVTQVCKGSTLLQRIQPLTGAEAVSDASLRLRKVWLLGPRTGMLSITPHGFKPLQKSLHAGCLQSYRKKDMSLTMLGEMKNKACFSWCAFWGGNSCLPSNPKREHYHSPLLNTSPVLKGKTVLFGLGFFFVVLFCF